MSGVRAMGKAVSCQRRLPTRAWASLSTLCRQCCGAGIASPSPGSLLSAACAEPPHIVSARAATAPTMAARTRRGLAAANCSRAAPLPRCRR